MNKELLAVFRRTFPEELFYIGVKNEILGYYKL